MLKIFLLVVAVVNSQWIELEGNSPPLRSPCPDAKPESSQLSALWFDGQDNIYMFSTQMWRYEIDTKRWLWQPEVPRVPKRTDSAYWSIQGKFYMYGGINMETNQTLGDLWYYEPEVRTFTQIPSASSIPCSGSAFWTHETTNRLYMWGGLCNNVTVNTLRSYDINSQQWEVNIPTHDGGTGTPSPAQHISATLKGDMVYLYTDDKLWELNIQTFTWSQSVVGNNGSPSGPQRIYHTMWTSSDGNIMLYGGQSGSKNYVDTWIYNHKHWTLKDNGNGPSPRWGFTTCTDFSGNLFLFGGSDKNNDLWKYGKFTVKNIFQLIEWKLDSATLTSTIAAVMSSLVFFGIIIMAMVLCVRRCQKKRRDRKGVAASLRGNDGDYDL